MEEYRHGTDRRLMASPRSAYFQICGLSCMACNKDSGQGFRGFGCRRPSIGTTDEPAFTVVAFQTDSVYNLCAVDWRSVTDMRYEGHYQEAIGGVWVGVPKDREAACPVA
jgi:hypothetical protein